MPRIITMQTSSLGSSTLTSWKRRASAGSFSKYFLYSDQVVAAIVRSSPRASAGLSRLAASFCPACAARADHGVRLVDEEDDRRGRVLDLLDQPLEPVLELALHAGARLQQRQVERADGDVAQRRRHVALRHALREALDHRRLADARLADEDRVVLPAAGQDVDHLPDLEVAAEHRVEPAPPRALGEVDGELVEVRRLAAGRGPALRPAARRRRWRRARLLRGAATRFGSSLRRSSAGSSRAPAEPAHHAAQLVVGQQREDGEAAADLPGAEVHGAERPGGRSASAPGRG
jgi:hypothetical protein